MLVLRDTLLEPVFKSHPGVVGAPRVRFYVGASIMVEGVKLGTLCICDTIPHPLFSVEDEQTMLDICETISSMISERRRQRLEEQFNGVEMHQNILTLLKSPLMHLQRSFLYLEGLAQQSLISDISPQSLTSFVALTEEMHELGEFLKNLLTTIPLLETTLGDSQQQQNQVVVTTRCEVADLIRLLQQSALNMMTVRSHLDCRGIDIPFADLPLLCFASMMKSLSLSSTGDACSSGDEKMNEEGTVDLMMADNTWLLIHCCFPAYLSSDLAILSNSPLFATISHLFQMIHGNVEVQGDHTLLMILPCRESTVMIPPHGPTPLLSGKSSIYCHIRRSSDHSQETDRSLTMSLSNDYTDRPRKSSLVPPGLEERHHLLLPSATNVSGSPMSLRGNSNAQSGSPVTMVWENVISPIAARLMGLGGAAKVHP